jgi:hypothetical protein
MLPKHQKTIIHDFGIFNLLLKHVINEHHHQTEAFIYNVLELYNIELEIFNIYMDNWE